MTFEFAHPWYLWLLLLVPPLLLCWMWRRRRSIRFPDFILLKGLPVGRSQVARWGTVLLLAGALASLIIAVAGPRSPDLKSRMPTEGIAIEMVVDVSGSMDENDFIRDGQAISRFDAVKYVFNLFVQGGELPDGGHLDGRPNDLIGLVVFGTQSNNICPPTLSHSVLIEMLNREKPRTLPDQSHTNISDGLVDALNSLQATDVKKKVLILLSDGEHNVPTEETGAKYTPRQVAQLAGSVGITIYTIDAAGPVQSLREGGLPKDAAAIREDGIRNLQEIANITRGSYFPAHDTENLLQVYQRIDELERSHIQTYQYRRYHEYFPWAGLACFCCLATLLFMQMTWWRRVP
jgi:Ca-activated chloride channel family protein